jgi:thioredoxin-related protein
LARLTAKPKKKETGATMKKQLRIAALIASFFALLIAASCSKPQTALINDFDQAQEVSNKSGKDLVIIFTGSDWNESSKTLLASVFTEDYIKKLSKKYVLCNIDILQDANAADEAVLQKNYTLASEYAVQAMPWFILQTPQGELYGSTAGAEESLTQESVISLFESFADRRKQLVTLKKKITSAKGTEKASAIDAFLSAVESNRREQYEDLIRQVPDLDPENSAPAADGTTGLRGKYMLQSAYLDAIGKYQNGALVEAGNTFFAVLDTAPLTGAQKQEALYMGAYMHAMSGETEETTVIEWLEKAVEADPDGEGAVQIRATIDQIRANAAAASVLEE